MSFSMFAGDTKRLNFTLTDGAGQPLDITDAIVRFQCARYRNGKFSSTPVITKGVGSGIEITDDFNGLLTVTLAPEDTEQLSGDFWLELEIEDASGDISTAHTSTFTVLRNLIRHTA